MNLNLTVFIATAVFAVAVFVTMDGIMGLVRATRAHAGRNVRMVIAAIIIVGAVVATGIGFISWGVWGVQSLWMLGAVPASLIILADMRGKA